MQHIIQSSFSAGRQASIPRFSAGLLCLNQAEGWNNYPRFYVARGARRNYYNILGITPKASQTQVKAAYYRLSKKFHPDINKEKDAQAKFSEINEAYEVLGNQRHRSKYDLGSLNPLDIRSGHDASRTDEEYEEMLKNWGRFKKRGPAPTGKTKYYDYDKFYEEHYGRARREQATETKKRNIEFNMEEERKFQQNANIRNKVAQAAVLMMLLNAAYRVFRRYK